MHQKTAIRTQAPAAALIMLLACSAAVLAKAADLQTLHRFSIPTQSLDTALLAFSDQAKVQVLMWAGAEAQVTSAGANGELRAIDALKAILANTGLAFKQIDAETVAIVKPGASREGGANAVGIASSSMKLAQAPVDSAAASRDDSDATGGGLQEASGNLRRILLEEVVVTGSRLIRPGNSPSPVINFDRETIRQLGVTDIADILDYLPQSSFSLGEDFIVGGAKPVQLRGLNFGTTLLLINGRRVVTSAAQGNRNFFDLNTIPLSAVERVEILSESASAVYGADAIGGVVNVILRNSSEDTVLDAYYGGADGGGEEFRGSATAGLAGESVRLLVGADYFKRSYLLGDERRQFYDQDYTPFGGPDYRSTVSNPGNVLSLAGPLPGLSSNQAGVPPGTDGIGLTPADFIATQGAAGLNRESSRRFASVLPESERIAGFANVEWDAAANATLFLELLYSQRDEARQLAPTTLSNGSISNTVGTRSGIIVPPTNPFNPFGAPVAVNYLFEGVGPREERVEEDFFRVAGGVRGTVGSWRYELAALHTQDDATQITTNEVDPQRVVAALAQTDPAAALNLFADGPGGSPELLASLVGDPLPGEFGSDAIQVGGHIAGALFSLPAGPVGFVLGSEWREEQLDFVIPSGLAINLHADRQTRAAFSELLIPLVGKPMGVPLIQELNVTAAVRYDRYSDFGGTTNPKLGLEWRPATDLLLRGTWGTSYRAPSLFELYFDRTSAVGQTIDPLRPPQLPGLPGELVTITLTSGGNPNLEAEEAESFSLGVLYQPSFLEGLEVSVDYFDIKQKLRVQSPDALTLMLNGDLFPDRVIRAPQTPEDIAAGLPGRLLAVDVTRMNLGRIETDGVDIRLRQRFETPLGTFSPSVSATWVGSYSAASFPNQPLVERVGLASRDPGTVPRWKGVASLSWSRQSWQAGAMARFVNSYRDVNVSGVKLERRIPEQWYFDLNASYKVAPNAGWSPLRGVTLRLGAINLFDRDVPYSDVNIIGYDPSQADIRGRFFYGSVSKAF